MVWPSYEKELTESLFGRETPTAEFLAVTDDSDLGLKGWDSHERRLHRGKGGV